MTMPNELDPLMHEISRIIGDELGKSPLKLTPQTTAQDVDGWDSLMHLQIIAAIERRCQVRFSAMQIYKFNSVGDIVSAVASAREKKK